MSGEPSRRPAGLGTGKAGTLRTFLSLYSSWKTLIINVVFFAAYYLLFYWLVVGSNSGYFLVAIPFPLLVLLVLASSALATVAVSYLRISLRRRSIPGVVESPVGLAFGALVVTCTCNLPLLAPALYFLGLNSLEVSGVISFFAAYQQEIVEGIVAVDVLSIYYYQRQISHSGLDRNRS